MFDSESIAACLTRYLQTEAKRKTARGHGCLDIVAARTKLPEYVLHEIASGERAIDAEIVDVLMTFLSMDELFTDDDVREYIQHFADNGKLVELAESAGLRSAPACLLEVVNNKDVPIDRLVRAQLLNTVG